MPLEKIKNKINYIIAFVLYNPPAAVFDRINYLLSENYEVYVFDNSPLNSQKFIKSNNLIGNINFKYFTSGFNSGLSGPLSILLSSAFYNGNYNLLYFDQDTDFNSNTLDFISHFISDNYQLFEKYSFVSLYGKMNNIKSDLIIHDHTHIILSGSLFNLSALESIGWFRGNYFVDGVDYKLCLDSINFGLRVGCFNSSPGFDHNSLQDNSFIVKILNKSIYLKKYNYVRIKGISISHFRLIIESFTSFQFLFSLRTLALLTAFLTKQFFIRIYSLVK